MRSLFKRLLIFPIQTKTLARLNIHIFFSIITYILTILFNNYKNRILSTIFVPIKNIVIKNRKSFPPIPHTFT